MPQVLSELVRYSEPGNRAALSTPPTDILKLLDSLLLSKNKLLYTNSFVDLTTLNHGDSITSLFSFNLCPKLISISVSPPLNPKNPPFEVLSQELSYCKWTVSPLFIVINPVSSVTGICLLNIVDDDTALKTHTFVPLEDLSVLATSKVKYSFASPSSLLLLIMNVFKFVWVPAEVVLINDTLKLKSNIPVFCGTSYILLPSLNFTPG